MSTKPKVQSYFSKKIRPVINTGPGLTEQHHKEDCDVNNIINRYTKTGVIKNVKGMGEYAIAPAIELREALDLINQAQNQFDQLPSNIRREFENDPLQFLEFVENPDNLEHARELGLAERPEPDETDVSEGVGQTTPQAASEGQSRES